jgi:DNA-binding CsgD family transcriptional regulator
MWVAAAEIERQLGNRERAHALLDRADVVPDADWTLYVRAKAFNTRVALLFDAGDVTAAERLAHDALIIAAEQGSRLEMAVTLELLASIAVARNSVAECVRLAAAARRLRDDMGLVVDFEGSLPRVDAALEACRISLGPEFFEAAWWEGYQLFDADAVEYARRARGERGRPSLGWNALTPTERRVAEEVGTGRSNPEIARALMMSRDTVKTHLRHVFNKLSITSRAELAAAVIQRHFDQTEPPTTARRFRPPTVSPN